jgi:hypothetical protein
MTLAQARYSPLVLGRGKGMAALRLAPRLIGVEEISGMAWAISVVEVVASTRFWNMG